MDSIRIFKHYVRIPFILLGIGEFIIMCLSISASANIIFTFYHHEHYQFFEYFSSTLISALLYALVMSLSMISIGLYQARLREGILGFLLRLSAALFLGTVALSLIFYIFPSLFVGRGVLLVAELISFIGIALIRNIIYFSGSSIFKKRILVLGAGERAASITELRRKSDQVGFTIVGFIHVRGEKNVVDSEKVIHINTSLLDLCANQDIDEIVIAINDRRKTLPMTELLDCKMSGVDIVDVLQFFERETSKIKLDHLHPSYLLYSDGFQQGIARQNIKRFFDVTISGLFLLVTWPIMAITAGFIILESGFGQPILYRQVRVGEDGKPFQVLKFRSMRTDAEKDGKAQWAVKNDSRITKVGSFIRKVRIDELPQIFNVFKGDMSFVGPRPERPEFVGELSDKIPYFSERHRIKPGITGWAQLSYPYGSSERDSLEKLQYDLYYVKNHSLFLDFLILLQTVEVVLFSRGAR